MAQVEYKSDKDIKIIIVGLFLYLITLILEPIILGISFLFIFMRLAALCVVLYGILGLFNTSPRLRKAVKFLKTLIHISITLFIILFIVVQCFIFNGMRQNDNVSVDYVLVLGAGLSGDKPSLMLQTRLDKAFEYLSENSEAIVILCGGQAEDEVIPEAEAMFNYLISRGANAESLLKETRSSDTDTNISYAAEIIKKAENIEVIDGIDVLIVSNEFHLYRSKLIAEKMGFNAYGLAAPTPDRLFMRFTYHLREFVSVMFAWLGI
ncbi:MAG: hypothetical protein K0S55_1683 [Clostridia bacterium]|nr:hypothetical protein [Clostridia bacterium]